jgi:hypothetical protein
MAWLPGPHSPTETASVGRLGRSHTGGHTGAHPS